MANNQRDRQFEIKLQYIDKKHDIDLITGVNSPSSLTIKNIICDAKEFLYLDDILLEHIQFIGYENEQDYIEIDGYSQETTLEELDITDGCILCFEPTLNAPPPKLCHLKVIGPDESEKRDFCWYRAKATVSMFLDFVIKEFSLQHAEQEQIHFFSIIDELDFWRRQDLRLCEFGLHDGMSVFIQLMVPSYSSTTFKQDQIIHIRCTCNETQFNLDMSLTSTIEDIKGKIKERYENYSMIDFELYNDLNDELISDDSNRTFESFGVKPNETLYARFQLDFKKKRIQNRNLKYTQVIINYHHPVEEQSDSFSAPLTATIDQIISKLNHCIKNHDLSITKMCSNKIEIDIKRDRTKNLVDLGFQENDIIDVFIEDKRAIIQETVSLQKKLDEMTATLQQTISLKKELDEMTPTLQQTISLKKELDEMTSTLQQTISFKKKLDEMTATLQHRNEQISQLHNLIDSIFIKSAFYCLAYIPQLSNFFLNDFHNSNNNEILSTYATLIRHTHLENQRNQSIDLILQQATYFNHLEYQNPKEFISYFLNIMHKELSKQNITIIKDLFFTDLISIHHKQMINLLSIPLIRQERIFKIKFIRKTSQEEQLYVTVPMNGRVENILDEFSHLFGRPSLFYRLLPTLVDGELNLSTPLNELITDELIIIEQENKLRTIRPKRLKYSDTKLTLDECLKTFFSKDNSQQYTLSHLPTILIIELPRFIMENNIRQKNQTFVHFPMTNLDFNQIIPSLQEPAIYDLIAVNHHHGSIYDPTYSVSVRDFKDNNYPWFHLIGKSVKYIEPDDYEYEIVTDTAYLLFYMKQTLTTEV